MLKNALPKLLMTTSAVALIAGCRTSPDSSAYYSSQPSRFAWNQVETDSAQTTALGAVGAATESQEGLGQSEDPAKDQPAAQTAQTDQPDQNVQMDQKGQMVIPLHEETVQIGKREVDAGGIRLRKQVTTETVNKPVEVRRESIVVDRLPADANAQAQQGAAAGLAQQESIATPFKEDEMVIHLKREEPVVEKRTVPAGQVVIQKKTDTDQVQVQQQIRRENVQVDKIGNPQNVTISENLRSRSSDALAQRENQPADAMGGGPALTGQQQGAGSSSAPITDISSLRNADWNSMAGRQVQLNGIRVEQVLGDRMFAFTGPNGQRLFVHTDSPLQGIQQGSQVNLKGDFRKVSQAHAMAGIDEQQLKTLNEEQVYIHASSLQPASR